MLIIFDLDDTLIDTSGSLTPHLLRAALTEMVAAGLPISDFEAAFSMLCRLNAASLTLDRAVLEEFLELEEAPSKYFFIGWKVLSAQVLLDLPVEPLDHAIETLHLLSSFHELALVTRGVEEVQREKMRRAGIEPSFFHVLHFCEADKKNQYAILGQDGKVTAENILVCGDRISIDLTPAKELGYKTVHVRSGRGLGNTGSKNDVDYTIVHLRELEEIVHTIEKKNLYHVGL